LRRKHEVERFVRAIPVKLYVFDLLYLDGRQLIDLPLLKRKKLLEGLLKPSEHVDIARYILTSDLGEARGFFKRVVEEGYEGVLIKDPASSYKPGERGKHWLKFKPRPESLDLVVVAVEYGHGKRAKLLSDYTFALRDEKGELVPIAKAYCGLTDKEIEEMTAYFKSIALRRTGRKLFVRPNVIVEVEFGEIQRSPHYPLGFALRFPRIKRIRWDKSLEDIDDIKRVREIFVKQRRYRG
jgi:DNA ligase-1